MVKIEDTKKFVFGLGGAKENHGKYFLFSKLNAEISQSILINRINVNESVCQLTVSHLHWLKNPSYVLLDLKYKGTC